MKKRALLLPILFWVIVSLIINFLIIAFTMLFFEKTRLDISGTVFFFFVTTPLVFFFSFLAVTFRWFAGFLAFFIPVVAFVIYLFGFASLFIIPDYCEVLDCLGLVLNFRPFLEFGTIAILPIAWVRRKMGQPDNTVLTKSLLPGVLTILLIVGLGGSFNAVWYSMLELISF